MKKKIILVLAVILLAAFLRFFTLAKDFVYTVDEQYLVDLAKTIDSSHPFKLIGVSVSVGIYLGALWTYLTALLLFIAKNNLLILGYAASLIGVMTTGAVILVGKRMFSFWVGLGAGLLYATLPLIVFFDQKFWNDSPIPLLSLAMLLSLYESRQNPRWWIVFALALGLVFHTHLMLLPYIFLAVPIFLGQMKRIPGKMMILSLTIVLGLISPLIVFDATHSWTSLKAPFRLIQSGAGGMGIARHGQMLFQTLGRVWYLTPGSSNADEINWGCTSLSHPIVPKWVDAVSTRTTPPVWVSLASLALLLWFISRPATWKSWATKLLAVSLILILSAFLVFPGGALEYYLLGAFPLLTFLPALLVKSLKGMPQKIVVFLLIGVAGVGFYTVMQADGRYGFNMRRELVRDVMKTVGSESFFLEELGGCQQYAGWRDFFISYGRRPSVSSIDSTLGWLYPNEIDFQPVKYTVAIRENRIFTNSVVKNRVSLITKGGFSIDVGKNN